MNLTQWAARWSVPYEAIAELNEMFGLNGTNAITPPKSGADTEDAALTAVRLEAPRKGVALWRNNVGALKREGGEGFIRFGLCNDSAALNAKLKSGDLIGIRRIQIMPEHVGHAIGQFVSREVKAPGWRFSGTDRENAQLAWARLVVANGGDAAFCTGEGSL